MYDEMVGIDPISLLLLLWFNLIYYYYLHTKNYNRPFFTQTNLNNYDFKYISIYGKINKHISNTV